MSNNAIATVPSKEEFEIIQTIAKCAVDSKYFDKMGGTPAIIMIALYAKEIGIPIATALMGGLQNVMGKITMSPELMNSLIRQNGHRIEILVSNSMECKIKGTRKDTGEFYTASFSIEDARKAGLYKAGGGWDKYPEDMCFARAISRLRRRLFPDIASRSYTTGELDEAKETIEVQSSYPTEPVKVQIEHKEPSVLITEDQVQHIVDLIGDDVEFKNNMLARCKATYGHPLFSALPQEKFDGFIQYIKKHNESRLEKEMADIGVTEKDKEEMQF